MTNLTIPIFTDANKAHKLYHGGHVRGFRA